MKNNTGKIVKKQEKYHFPQNNSEFYDQIIKQEIIITIWNGQDFNEELGLNRGDILLYYPTSEIDENQLTILQSTKKETFFCGFAYENFGDIGVINPFYENCDRTYKKREVAVLGVVVGIVKPYDAQKFPNFHYEKPAHSEEITAVCNDCKATISGTPKFIKSQGWSLGKKETLCLNCDLFGGGK